MPTQERQWLSIDCGLLVLLCPTYLEYLAIEINMGFAEKLQQFPEFGSQSQ